MRRQSEWPNENTYSCGEEQVPRLLFATSEIADFVKAGGLGDVSSALPRALRQANDIRVLVPGYRQVTAGRDIRTVAELPAVGGLPRCTIGALDMPDGLEIYAVICPDLYDREGSPYGDASGKDWHDNDIRFARLSLAAADIAGGVKGLGWKPDLLHVNDWQTGLAPAYLAWRGHFCPTVMTVHNLAYQGVFGRDRLSALAIPERAFAVDGVEFYGSMSFLKAGLYYASHVTTVSETYSREITLPEHGCGLEGLLQTRFSDGRLTGIINGIDPSWDSRTDPRLSAHFNTDDLSGKWMNSVEARQAFGLEVSRGPLFSIISRLVHQKGVDLSIEATEKIVEQGGQVAVIGSGEAHFEEEWRSLARRHYGKVGVHIGFNEEQARTLFAGSDFLLMPSRFEPCGLSQMYAQRYGSLPVAYKTGGLADTIEDGETGFLFNDLSVSAMLEAVTRAFASFGSKGQLNRMRRKAMARPPNWQRSAGHYSDLYRNLTQVASPD